MFTLTNPAGNLPLLTQCRLIEMRVILWIVTKVTYITGISQTQNEASGKLGTIKAVGNLWRIRLNSDKQSGTWKINIKSTEPYALKVTGIYTKSTPPFLVKSQFKFFFVTREKLVLFITDQTAKSYDITLKSNSDFMDTPVNLFAT